MKCSYSLCLVTAAVLVFFVGHLDASGLTKALSDTVEAEKIVASKSFQDMQEAIIMKGTDTSSLVAQAIIETLRQAALQCKADGVSPLAVDTALEGFLSVIRLVTGSSNKSNQAIDKAEKLYAQYPEAAKDVIKNEIKADSELVFLAGVPIHDAQGALLVQIGGAAQPGLKKSITCIQKAATAALESLDMVNKIVNMGIDAGEHAAEEGFKAGREAVLTGGSAVVVYLLEAAKHTFDALRYAASKGLGQGDLVSGIIDSLKTTVSTDSQAALAAIARINKGLESVLSNLTKKPAIDAANVMAQGLITTILETANAISVAKKSLDGAVKLSGQDIEAAISAVGKHIQEAEDEVVSGSAGAYLGIGAAGKILGNVEVLVPSVIEIEYGVIEAFEELRMANELASLGLRAKGIAALQSIPAASQICEAAGNALYTQFADAGEIGFNALMTLQ